MARDIKLIEVRSEIAAGTRGASLGIGAMKVASLDKESNFFGIHSSISVKDENDLLFKNNSFKTAKHIDGVHTMLTRVAEATDEVVKEGLFPMVLAGDHSTAAGTIIGLKRAYPEQRIGVIWIDAHADLHTPYTTPSGNMHGMPLAMVSALDNLECKANDPIEETKQRWEDIKNIAPAGPKINPEDIVFIAVRDTEGPEDELLKRHNIRNFRVSEVREKGAEAIAAEAMQSLDHCDLVYISFDVDSMDSRISEGTGTPVIDGLEIEEATALNNILITNPKVCGWEIVEVNPTLDSENKMAEIAFDILESTALAYSRREEMAG